MMFDVHAHIHGFEFDVDRDSVVEQARAQDIGIITVGTDYEESARAVLCAQKYDMVYATVGIHPVDKIVSFQRDALTSLARNSRVVAIGECGLDYHWPSQDGWKTGEVHEKKRQKDLFIAQIELALELQLPLMIHGRPSKKSMDAYEDILEILEKYISLDNTKLKGNVHFFVGSLEVASRFWQMGFTTSFTGVITFTHQYDEVVKSAPLEAILAETDSPYATPVPHRGIRNTPIFVDYVYDRIAELRGISKQDIILQLHKNRIRIFGV